MYGLKARTIVSPMVEPQATQRRRYVRPFFFQMGPVALCITCVLLLGFMAVLYLSQVGEVVVANHQLQTIRNEQAALERQNQDLVDTIAQEQSPAYIAEQVKKMGLGPVDTKNLWILQVSHMQQIGKEDQSIQP